jgi:hypothetical protein
MLPVIGFKVNTLTINLSVLGITDIQHLDVYIDNLSVVSFKEYKNYVSTLQIKERLKLKVL